MKTGIHPKYVKATVTCACGHSWETMSTRETIKTDLCSNCHPFYTGEQRIVDTAGQVERFMRRMGNRNAEAVQQPLTVKRTSKNRANVAPPPQERRPAPAAPATDADANAESDQSAEVETAEV